jgi:hypothetical protein
MFTAYIHKSKDSSLVFAVSLVAEIMLCRSLGSQHIRWRHASVSRVVVRLGARSLDTVLRLIWQRACSGLIPYLRTPSDYHKDLYCIHFGKCLYRLILTPKIDTGLICCRGFADPYWNKMCDSVNVGSYHRETFTVTREHWLLSGGTLCPNSIRTKDSSVRWRTKSYKRS